MGRWTKGKTLSVQEVRMKNGLVHGTIDCLTEGSEYMFRIKAVNKGGPSEPSDPSDSMIAKIRFSKGAQNSLYYVSRRGRVTCFLEARACDSRRDFLSGRMT